MLMTWSVCHVLQAKQLTTYGMFSGEIVMAFDQSGSDGTSGGYSRRETILSLRLSKT